MSSRRKQVRIIALREILERGRSKVFRISMVVMVLLIVGGIVAFSVFAGQGSDPITIGISGETPPSLSDELVAAGEVADQDVEVVSLAEADVESELESGVVDVVVVDGMTVVTQGGASSTVEFITSAAIRAAAIRELVATGEVSAEDVETIVNPVTVVYEQVEEGDPAEDAKAVVSWIAAILLFTTILMFGQFVAMGIVEEKQNRVVEVVISRVETSSLLIGKVLGIGALGLAQVGVFVLAGVVTLLVVPTADLPDIDITAIGIPALLWVLVWFILGYLLYSFLYAGLGATVSRQEELQGVAYIPAMLLMPAYFLTSVLVGSEIGTLGRVASLVPFWSPIVMPLRITKGDAAVWEIVLSLVLIIATTVAIVALATRVYRGAALRTGGKVKLSEAIRSADA